MAAFDLALEQGADGFEFDVRRTSNRQAVICHDPKFNRLTVSRHTLKQLTASCASPNLVQPCLEDVLSRYGRAAFLNIEVKVRGMERAVVRALQHDPPERGYLVSSFLPGVVRELHSLGPKLVLGILCQSSWQLRRWSRLPGSHVVPHYRLLSRKLVDEIHDAGKQVVTWTVNERKQMLRAAELGVDGIISDDTRLLCELFSKQPRPV